MGVAEFWSDNDGYLRWVAEHDDGFVINIQRSLNPGDARVHRAACHWIRGRPPRGKGFAGAYIKICGESLAELSEWARNRVRSRIRDCRTCRPTGSATSGQVTGLAERPGQARPSLGGSGLYADHEIEGPTASLREVWLWADKYIPFEHLSTAQRAARAELQDRLALLSAGTGEILHANYAGQKPGNMDVENLVLYNIGGTCFRPSGRHGVRFEMADGPRRRPASGRPFYCSYQYRLIRNSAELAHWRPVRRLACFADVSLGAFSSHARLAQTWFAVRQGGATLADRGISGDSAPFAVLLTLSCPQGAVAWPSPDLVKPLVDGVVAAFQSHSDRTQINEVSARIGAALGEDEGQIARMLLDARQAVLGVAHRLVYVFASTVQWNPRDHMCMAGEVVCEPGAGQDWRLRGEVWDLVPRQWS